MRTLRGGAVDCLLLFAIAAALVWPLFTATYLDKWSSIESSFIAEVRYTAEHFPPPRWQPLYYNGTRYDYVYAMGLRIGPALLVRWFGLDPAHAYHFYSALFYCLGIPAAYWLARVLLRSRWAGWFVGLGFALTSPSFLVAHPLRADSQFWEPVRLGVLVRYGEGPHSSSITFLLLALAFSWRALRGSRWLDVAAAAACSALVVWHNFYGATALAIAYPVLAWTLGISAWRRAVWFRAAAIPVLAYGLIAFWLTPSYIRITRHNVQYIADKPNAWSWWLAGASVLLFLGLSWWWVRKRPDRALAGMLAGLLFFFTLEVAGYYHLGFVVFGNPHRHVPELDFVVLLCAAGAVAWLAAHRPARTGLVVAAVLSATMLVPAQTYVRKAWKLYLHERNYWDRVEYELSTWVKKNMPDSRAHVSGSIRFWYMVWHDVAQIEGAQDPGILNDSFMPAHWEIVMGREGEISKQWLQVFGADLIVVNDKSSREVYHDQQHPEKFVGLMPVLYDNKRGDVIYRVPRRYPGLARVVETKKLDALPPIQGNGTRESLAPYVELLENGPDAPVRTRRERMSELHVTAPVEAGQSVVIQESYDPPWRAYVGEREIPVSKTFLGFMRLDPPPGTREIRLVFTTPLENAVGGWISAATLLALPVLAAFDLRRRRAPMMGSDG